MLYCTYLFVNILVVTIYILPLSFSNLALLFTCVVLVAACEISSGEPIVTSRIPD